MLFLLKSEKNTPRQNNLNDFKYFMLILYHDIILLFCWGNFGSIFF